MGFNDLLENSKKYKKRNYNYRGDYNYPHHRYEEEYPHRLPGKHDFAVHIIENIWNNRKLKLLFILFAMIMIIAIISALFLLLPLLLPLLNEILDSVAQSGLKGVVEEIIGFLARLWNGSGN
jgi:hypothetical protein